jgi:hypothetical protein
VATVGRREFPSYTALAASWAKNFAVPSLPAPAVTEAVSPLDGVSSDPTPSE